MVKKTASQYAQAIQGSGKTIYTPIEVGDPEYWIPTDALENLLNAGLKGKSLVDLALRTRSKVVKTAVCEVLGYPVPKSFTKVKPRFLGQQLDIYTQKSLNLQIWNEELSPERRYALIEVTPEDKVGIVKVVNGQQLAKLDTTGTITTKYQAGVERGIASHELVSEADTLELSAHTLDDVVFSTAASPINSPVSGELMTIQRIFSLLSPIVGSSFPDPGRDQERNRGAALHKMVCQHLGYSHYEDTGQFPDVTHQLLEVKLQTSATIDLGLVQPNSESRLDIENIRQFHPRHCDTRYAIFFAETDNVTVKITNLYLVTGADFFSRFRRFEGRIQNGKIQMPLPKNFFRA